MTAELASAALALLAAVADAHMAAVADRRNVHALLARGGSYAVVGRGVTRHKGGSSYRVSGLPSLHRPAIG